MLWRGVCWLDFGLNFKEVDKVLTKEQRLKLENCVLKRVIDQVKRAADKLDGEASGDGGNGIAALGLKERLKNAIDYGFWKRDSGRLWWESRGLWETR